MGFSWWEAILVFLAYCSTDWLFTIYTLSIVERKKLIAANVSAGIFLIGAFGVIHYVGDWRYVFPMVLGGWVGTYLSVWHQEYKDREKL